MSINIIGVTGPSGAGKSALGKIIGSADVPVIDADKVYHSLLVANSPCAVALRNEFGTEVLDENGVPDRKRLSSIVFSSPEKLQRLNDIVLGFVLDELRTMISQYELEGKKYVLVDAPTLIESGFSKECDIVISVLADKEKRIERICSRDGISRERAEQRVNAQPSDDLYINNSHHTLKNNGNSKELETCVKELFAKILG